MKHTKMITALSAIATLGLIASPVYADGDKSPKSPVEKMMKKFDTNQDGQISQEEVVTVRTEFFTNADTNADGALSLDEFRTGKEKKDEKRFNEHFVKMDVDNSGALSLEEFLSAKKDRMMGIDDPESELKDRFTKMDTDNSASLTAEELMEGRKNGICKGGKDDDEDDKKEEKDEKYGNLEERFAQMDADKDGAVSKAEFDASASIFDTFDANKDGIITKDEMASVIKGKRGKMGMEKGDHNMMDKGTHMMDKDMNDRTGQGTR